MSGLIRVAIAALVAIFASGVAAAGPGTAFAIASKSPLPELVERVRTGVVEIRTADGAGSGFLIADDFIATVEHVVAGAKVVTVNRDAVSVGSAVVVGADTMRDIALLRLCKPTSGYHFKLADRDPRLGEDVALLGFPFDLPLTVTRGSISGTDRTIRVAGVARTRLMQTDAAANPGNSGGPLLSVDDGTVLGLVDLGTTEANGIAFAVSSRVASALFTAWKLIAEPSTAECAARPASPPSLPSSGVVVAARASQSSLTALSVSTHRPIYWAGKQAGVTFEFSRAADKRAWVRYLPTGVSPGSKTPYLTIGTYPVKNAFAKTTQLSRQAGSVKIAAKGGVGFYMRARPTSVYVAFPNTDYQIEVFAPEPTLARRLVAGGQITPIQTARVDFRLPGTTTATTATPGVASGLTATALSKRVAAAGHPVYWSGKQLAGPYELTQGYGRDWIRYLPVGVKAARAGMAYRTIGTYALKGAYKVTAAAAKGADVTVIAVKNGVAFYAKTRPNNVYVAYRGIDYQIEVYDPDAATAQELVTSGQIVPVP